MQSKFIATLVVAGAVITAVSCKWFQSKSSADKQFNIVGKWNVDTMYSTGNDSTKQLLSVAFLDKSYSFRFKEDSVVNMLSKKDSTEEKYYLKNDTLFIKEDSTYNPYQLRVSNDSLISITSKDSIVIALKKQ